MGQTQKDYGKVLFEDDYHYRFHRFAWAAIGSVGIFLGIILGIVFWISSGDVQSLQNGFAMSIFFILLGIFIIFLRRLYHKFRIYENGISFTEPWKEPFLSFDQINYIIKDGHDSIIIRRKAPNENNPLFLSSGDFRPPTHNLVGNWSQFLETLEIQLKQTHPKQNEAGLIREIPERQLKR